MADKSIADLPVSGSMTDDALLALYQNGTTNSITGALIKSYAQNAVASQVTAAQTAAEDAEQSANQAEEARQGAAAAQTAAENAQDAAETARDQSVAAAGTIGDSVEQVQDAASQASSAKDAAVDAQTAAETAKTAAEAARGQAQTAATQAAGSATAAQTAATQADAAKGDTETARNEAETSASSAANSASDAESAAAEAERAKIYIENMDMEGETLPAGSSVTVTKTTSPEGNLLFVIGVPQGIQGDKGDTGETGATGPQGVSVTNATVNENGDLVITLSAGDPINAGSVIGPQGVQGDVGPTGASVDRIERTSGTGAPGTTDTYTVYLTNGQTGGTFQVYNGSNGTGSGDFMADGSVPMTGNLQMSGNKVINMALPTESTDGATKGYVDSAIEGVEITTDASPTQDSTNPVQSGGVYTALQEKQDKLTGQEGQVVGFDADGNAVAQEAPSGLPEGGTEGQILAKTSNGNEWTNPAGWSVGDVTGAEVFNDDHYNEATGIYSHAEGRFTTASGELSHAEGCYSNAIGDYSHAEGNLATAEGEASHAEGINTIANGRGQHAQGKYNIENNTGTYAHIVGNGTSHSNRSNAHTLDWDGNAWFAGDVFVGGSNQASGEKLMKEPTGTQGQYLGFTANNTVGAVDAPEPGLTQEQADERYLQLTGGAEITGPVYTEETPISDYQLVNKKYVDSKAANYNSFTLTNSGWSNNTQTVTVPGVSASETAQLITPVPAIDYQSAYYEAGIMCTGQAEKSLTFTCQTVPTINMTVYVVIQPLGGVIDNIVKTYRITNNTQFDLPGEAKSGTRIASENAIPDRVKITDDNGNTVPFETYLSYYEAHPEDKAVSAHGINALKSGDVSQITQPGDRFHSGGSSNEPDQYIAFVMPESNITVDLDTSSTDGSGDGSI